MQIRIGIFIHQVLNKLEKFFGVLIKIMARMNLLFRTIQPFPPRCKSYTNILKQRLIEFGKQRGIIVNIRQGQAVSDETRYLIAMHTVTLKQSNKTSRNCFGRPFLWNEPLLDSLNY